MARNSARGILIGAALAITSVVFAQQAAPPNPLPETQRRFAEARERLQLTPEQEPQLRALFQEEAAKMRAVQAKYGTDDTYATKAEKGRELRAIRADFRGRLKTILTPEQLAEWDKMVAERRDEAMERRQQTR
ncbi:MAG TPA: hypothetical protein VMG60_20000 [Burkholderiaceae bacterium]|nr:hypothetical protein [Burkholderiaceae bacterium]